jgi:5,10-methylenetetrahydromethanopterin reductase
MEYGFMMGVSPREPLVRVAQLCRKAEDLGYAMAWVGDSQLILKDSTVALALAANSTSRINLGPGVANPVTRHYTVIADWMAGMNEVSSGRAVLGIGVGDSAITPLGLKAATVEELEKVIKDIRQLASGREITVSGKSVKMLAANEPFPILVSASQRRMLRLAGQVADGVILMGGANADLTQWQLDRVAEGAERAGRRLEDIFVDLWFGISITDDVVRGRNDVRAWVTSQSRWFSRWKELPPPLKDFEHEFQEAFARYEFSEHMSVHSGHSKETSDDLVDLIAVCGPPDRCVERIKPLLKLKVDRITITLLPGGREERLRQFAEDVVPHLNAA